MGAFSVSVGMIVALGLAQADPNPDHKPKSFLPLPEVVIDSPRQDDTRSCMSNCAVVGRLSSRVSDTVRIQLLADEPAGPTPIIGISGVHVNAKGEFALTVDVPEGGWPPHGVRVWATVPGLPQVKGESRFNVQGRDVQPAKPIVETPSSGIVIDWDNLPALPPHVTYDESFVIRGAFADPRVVDPIRGPSVMIATMTGPVGGVTVDEGIFLSLRDPENRSQFLFEAPLTVHQDANRYTLRVKILSHSADRREEDITVIPVRPKTQRQER